MNAKPGDICRIVGVPGNEMALVEVVGPSGCDKVHQPAWHCLALSLVLGNPNPAMPGQKAHIADCALRPLHDGDGVDEILQKVGLPTFPLERQEA